MKKNSVLKIISMSSKSILAKILKDRTHFQKSNSMITSLEKEHQINIINHVETEKTLSVELNDMHPADVFNTLINYWGCTWIMKDNIIRIIKQSDSSL